MPPSRCTAEAAGQQGERAGQGCGKELGRAGPGLCLLARGAKRAGEVVLGGPGRRWVMLRGEKGAGWRSRRKWSMKGQLSREDFSAREWPRTGPRARSTRVPQRDRWGSVWRC